MSAAQKIEYCCKSMKVAISARTIEVNRDSSFVPEFFIHGKIIKAANGDGTTDIVVPQISISHCPFCGSGTIS